MCYDLQENRGKNLLLNCLLDLRGCAPLGFLSWESTAALIALQKVLQEASAESGVRGHSLSPHQAPHIEPFQ